MPVVPQFRSYGTTTLSSAGRANGRAGTTTLTLGRGKLTTQSSPPSSDESSASPEMSFRFRKITKAHIENMSVSPANGTTATAAATLTQSSSGTALLVRVWSLAGTQSSSEFGADPASSNFGTTSAGAGHRICASSLAMDCRGLIADPVCSCPDGGLQQNNSKSQWVGSGHQWLDQRVGNGMKVGCNGSARVGRVAAVVCNGSELSPRVLRSPSIWCAEQIISCKLMQ